MTAPPADKAAEAYALCQPSQIKVIKIKALNAWANTPIFITATGRQFAPSEKIVTQTDNRQEPVGASRNKKTKKDTG